MSFGNMTRLLGVLSLNAYLVSSVHIFMLLNPRIVYEVKTCSNLISSKR